MAISFVLWSDVFKSDDYFLRGNDINFFRVFIILRFGVKYLNLNFFSYILSSNQSTAVGGCNFIVFWCPFVLLARNINRDRVEYIRDLFFLHMIKSKLELLMGKNVNRTRRLKIKWFDDTQCDIILWHFFIIIWLLNLYLNLGFTCLSPAHEKYITLFAFRFYLFSGLGCLDVWLSKWGLF